MTNLKIINQKELKSWAKEFFLEHNYKMIDVSDKQPTFRKALATGKIIVGKETFELIQTKKMPKGDPISLAEIAAVLGVKKTSDIIPLCHPLPIDHTATKIIMNEDDFSLEIYCVVSAQAKTGVEMEALTAVSVASLTVYDMCKAIDKAMVIGPICLLEKQGGKSGDWSRPASVSEAQ